MSRALASSLEVARRVARLPWDERGISTSEFVVLLVCIAVAGIAIVKILGGVILDIIGVES